MQASTPTRTREWPLAGAGNVFRKEVQEWFRTRRFWLTSVVSTLLLACVSIGVFLNGNGLSKGKVTVGQSDYHDMMTAWIALSLTLGNYVMIALTMGILVNEERDGTAQWLFTKPLSRTGYGLAKFAANALLGAFSVVILPGLLFLLSLQLLYAGGVQHWGGAFIAMAIASFHAMVVIAFILALSV